MSWTKTLLSIACAITVLSSSLAPAVANPCNADDLPCLRLELLNKADEVVSLTRRLGLKDQQVQSLQEGITLVVQQRDLAQAALQSMTAAAQKLQPHWYEHPALWLSMGILGGILLTVLGGLAIGQAAHVLHF